MDCLIILLFSMLTPVFSFPFGAGPSACRTLVPGHLKEPQPANTLPFRIEPDADHFELNRTLTVRIRVDGKGKPGTSRAFSGFFVQARAPNGTEAVGQWFVEGQEAEARVKTQTCFHPADSVTHTDSKPKRHDIIMHFLPTGNMPDRIQFMGTIARDYAHYWTNVRSYVISRVLTKPAKPSASPLPQIPPLSPPSPTLFKEISNLTYDIVHGPLPLLHKASNRTAKDNNTLHNYSANGMHL